MISIHPITDKSSFGGDQTKHQLVNFIYKNINLSTFKYDTLEVESELPQLISKKYFVSANFSGSNCLLVFAKIKDIFHTFLVDRKTLSFNPQRINIQNVKLTNVNFKIKDVNIYQGTIFDGTYVQNKNGETFIITDVYMFKGQDLTKSQLDSKLLTVLTYLQSNYVPDKSNKLSMVVNKIYELTEAEHVINKVVPSIKGFLVRGICFYPEISGTKLLFKFGNENNTNNQVEITRPTFQHAQKLQISNDKNSSKEDSSSESNYPQNVQSVNIPKAPEIKKIKKTIYIPKPGRGDESYVFEMKKTETVDVYKLNALENVVEDSKTYMKRKQICLAYIPNMNRSKWCRETLENTDGKILVNCKYYPEKHKWEPILISTSKKPSFIDEFDIRLIEN